VVSEDERYTPEVQNRMIRHLLTEKRPKVGAYIRGESDDLSGALKQFGAEWEAYKKDPKEGIRVLKALREENL
jgi:hypothetical protein